MAQAISSCTYPVLWLMSPLVICSASKASVRGRLHPARPVEGATLAPLIDKCDTIVKIKYTTGS